jgi:hypothetical protein
MGEDGAGSMRRSPAILAVLLSVVVSLVSIPAGASAAGCPILFGCSPAGAAPAVSVTAPSDITADSAVLRGTVDPNGLSTTYTFEYAANGGAPQLLQTPAVTLAAGLVPQTVTATVTGLTPETTYAVELVATNSRGSHNATTTFATLLPPRPALTVARPAVDHQIVTVGTAVQLSAQLSGPLKFYETYFGAPDAALQSAPQLPALTLPSLADVSVPSTGMANFLPLIPAQNTRFRVRVDGTTGPWLTVYVNPLTELYTTPIAGGRTALSYTASGALKASERQGPPAYFYRGPHRGGPYRRSSRTWDDRSMTPAVARAPSPDGAQRKFLRSAGSSPSRRLGAAYIREER